MPREDVGFGRSSSAISTPVGANSPHPEATDWNVAVVLPAFAVASYRATDSLRVGAMIAAQGDQYRFDNDGTFDGQSEQLDMRISGGRVALFGQYQLTDSLRLRVDLGALGPRRLRIVDDGDDIAESEIEPGGYLSTSLVYTL